MFVVARVAILFVARVAVLFATSPLFISCSSSPKMAERDWV